MFKPFESIGSARPDDGLDPRATEATGWLPWNRKGSSTKYIPIDEPSTEDLPEPRKFVITKRFLSQFCWHIPALVSCLGTGVLLYLNFTNHVIGPVLGGSPLRTRNIFGALQLAAKAHEIAIIFSLSNIARQWVQDALIHDGILLGLVGSESLLSNLGLLVSREFRVAFRGSFAGLYQRVSGNWVAHGRWHRAALFLHVLLLSIFCFLCAVAGPASAVLMIPRYDWTQERNIEIGLDKSGPTNYPHIFIDIQRGSTPVKPLENFFSAIPNYWDAVFEIGKPDNRHRYTYGQAEITINTTTTKWDRSLDTDADWDGSTRFTSVMYNSSMLVKERLAKINPGEDKDSTTLTVADMTGIEATIVCRGTQKVTCSAPHNPVADSGDWCYFSATEKYTDRVLRTTNDLLLVHNYSIDYPLLWVTEGPETVDYPGFTDSIMFIVEVNQTSPGAWPQGPQLVVCSTSATLKTVTASSTRKFFSPEMATFHDYISYCGDKSCTTGEPRKVLYHQSWLDAIHVLNKSSDRVEAGVIYPDNRDKTKLPINEDISTWGYDLVYLKGFNGSWWWQSTSGIEDASMLEILVGGAYLSTLLVLTPSDSPYPNAYLKDGRRVDQIYPPELSIDTDPGTTPEYSNSVASSVGIYNLVYRYGLSSRSSVAGVTILIAHAFIALLGSLWQLRKGRIIRAWGSIPEYMTLCLGSDFPSEVENTCAGIDRSKTLSAVVSIREVAKEHLALVVMPDNISLLAKKKLDLEGGGESSLGIFVPEKGKVDLKKRYGYLGAKGDQGKEKIE